MRLERHVGDLVDIERAVMRFFQRADLARAGARALLGAEQLELHAVRHHGGGVEHHERPVGAAPTSRASRGRRAPCRSPTVR